GSVTGVREPGALNGPAGTAAADVMVTFGMVSAFRLAHGVPAGAPARGIVRASTAMMRRIITSLLVNATMIVIPGGSMNSYQRTNRTYGLLLTIAIVFVMAVNTGWSQAVSRIIPQVAVGSFDSNQTKYATIIEI